MTLKIYGTAASRAFRTLWAAEELGLPYEHIPYAFTGPEIKSAEFLARNPNGSVPVIDDGGLVVWESLAINLYLARTYGAGTLGAAHPAEEAHLQQWAFWTATEIETPTRNWFQHTVYLPETQRVSAVVDLALEALGKKLAVADQQFAQRPWLVGERFTVADLNLAGALMRLKELGGEAYPHVVAWHARCLQRPAAQRAVALRNAAMPAR
ncbi:MAG: glutathione S-transferase family protein [Limnohabitans sp.]